MPKSVPHLSIPKPELLFIGLPDGDIPAPKIGLTAVSACPVCGENFTPSFPYVLWYLSEVTVDIPSDPIAVIDPICPSCAALGAPTLVAAARDANAMASFAAKHKNPSATCAACSAVLPLSGTLVQRATSTGKAVRVEVECPSCGSVWWFEPNDGELRNFILHVVPPASSPKAPADDNG